MRAFESVIYSELYFNHLYSVRRLRVHGIRVWDSPFLQRGQRSAHACRPFLYDGQTAGNQAASFSYRSSEPMTYRKQFSHESSLPRDLLSVHVHMCDSPSLLTFPSTVPGEQCNTRSHFFTGFLSLSRDKHNRIPWSSVGIESTSHSTNLGASSQVADSTGSRSSLYTRKAASRDTPPPSDSWSALSGVQRCTHMYTSHGHHRVSST